MIDSVYQKVLAITNKEQRGYITPQEFNLFANRAQREIYNSYFDEIRNAEAKIKNQQQFSDIIEQVEEKLQTFKSVYTTLVSYLSSTLITPSDVNRIISAEIGNGSTQFNSTKWYPIEIVSQRELTYILNNPLTAPTAKRPIAVRKSGTTNYLEFYPFMAQQGVIRLYYYKAITKAPKWTYVVVNEQALFNEQAPDYYDFMLHPSEEENLVNKILQLAGIAIKQPDVQQAGMVAKQMANQDKNN